MKKYVYKLYSEIFPKLYEQERDRIKTVLINVMYIEQAGSTAVPNLGGKGIIDIAIVVNKQDLETASEQLQKLGYEMGLSFSTPERLYFTIILPDPGERDRKYHVHLTYPENNVWKDLIDFKDYLKNHPDVVKEYSEVKKQAAIEANDNGEKYREIKKSLIVDIHSRMNEKQ